MEKLVPVYTLSEVMNDLCARFVINNPENEYRDPKRFLFLMELSHWFYQDHLLKELPYLPKIVNFKTFVETFIKELNWKTFDLKNIDNKIFDWENYKRKIPVVGAMLLNEDLTHVVRVRQPNASYFSFPRGKMNLSEDPKYTCLRETKEETGIVLSLDQIKDEWMFKIDKNQNNSNHLLTYYVIPYISKDVVFQPMCDQEIAEVKWEKIEDIDPRHYEKEKLLRIIKKIKKEEN